MLGAIFSAEENSVVTSPHLYPSNKEKDLSAYLKGQYYSLHMLVKLGADDLPEHQQDPPVNSPDTDDQGNDIEKPIAWPSRTPRSRFGRPGASRRR